HNSQTSYVNYLANITRMADQASKKPLLRPGWLRVAVFGIAFCLLTLLIAIPAVMLVAGVTADQLKEQLIPTLSGLMTGNYLWLLVLVQFAIAMISVGLFRIFVDRRSMGSLGWSLDAFPGEGLT